MELEETLIAVAKQKLRELKSYVTSPDMDDEQMRLSMSDAFSRLSQLTEFALIADSGLSEQGRNQLIAIESETSALCRTFNWLYGPNC